MMEDKEPTVLDYVKSKLMPWKGIRVEIPESKLDEYIDKIDNIRIEDELQLRFSPITKTRR